MIKNRINEALAPVTQPVQNIPQVQPTAVKSGSQDTNPLSILKSIVKDKYPMFVQRLQTNITDPKFITAIKQAHATGAKVDPQKISAAISKLIPTQNEIDITKSLNYPLTNPKIMELYLAGGTVSPGGASIVTSGGGRYVIDGHHRWSQVYVINPACTITALDLSDVSDPVDALKATQLGIVAATNMLPSSSVSKGSGNLLTIDQTSLMNYVTKTTTQEVLDTMQRASVIDKADPSLAAQYIWKNVELMQKNNQPVPSASSRTLMPQTDDAGAANALSNAPNPEEPPLAESLRRIKQLAGLK